MAEGHVAGGENDRGRVFRFADFEFDARTVELRRAGAKVRLEGQPLKILQLLLQRPGDLVTREDLRRQLWPSNTIVDFDHGINYAVTRLREALGDSSEAPRFIETLPRRGYRFVHPLNPVPAENPPPAPARHGWHAVLLGLAFVLVVLFALNVFGLRERWMASSEPGSIALAVLPLKNLSADPGQDYYADGLTEALITELGKIGRLQVLSFHSVNRYRETSKTLPEIARELRVDVLLEGAVLRSATRVRVTVKLLQAMPERQLLAESYDFDAQDVLALQAEVARDVAARTRVTVTPQEQSRVAAKRRVDPQAYEAYLLARAYSARSMPGGALRAKEYFERAIAKDPTYAPAYAGLAELHADSAQVTVFRNPGEARARSRELATQALSLDDGVAEAHAALARVAQQEWDWPAAERAYRRAVEVNPSYAMARIWYAMYLYAMERFDEAAVQARRAQQLDPASSYVNAWAGAAYFFAGQVDAAMATWQLALELDPGYASTSLALARTYVSRGSPEQAIAVLTKALAYKPKDAFLLGALAHAFARHGQRSEALKLVRALEQRHAKGEIFSPFGLIWAYAGLEDHEAAFAWLEQAYGERRDRMIWLKVDPLLAPLRNDPRFASLVKRMNMPTQIAKR